MNSKLSSSRQTSRYTCTASVHNAHHDFYSNLPIEQIYKDFVCPPLTIWHTFLSSSFWVHSRNIVRSEIWLKFILVKTNPFTIAIHAISFHYKNYTFCTHSTGSGHLFSFETLLYLVHSYELSRICHTRDTTQELFLVGCELWCFLTHFDDFGNGSHSSQHKYLLSTYMYLVQMPSIAPHMYK